MKDSSSNTRTGADGSFIASIDAPLDLFLVGLQAITLAIEPVEPSYASLEMRRSILIVNPAYTGLILLAFISVGIVLFRSAKPKPIEPREGVVIARAEVPEPTGVIPLPRPKYELADIKGRILSAYLAGLVAVEKAANVVIAAHMTLTEFCRAVAPSLGTAAEPFRELTTLAEEALYSAHDLGESLAARAGRLATIVKQELRHEPA